MEQSGVKHLSHESIQSSLRQDASSPKDIKSNQDLVPRTQERIHVNQYDQSVQRIKQEMKKSEVKQRFNESTQSSFCQDASSSETRELNQDVVPRTREPSANEIKKEDQFDNERDQKSVQQNKHEIEYSGVKPLCNESNRSSFYQDASSLKTNNDLVPETPERSVNKKNQDDQVKGFPLEEEIYQRDHHKHKANVPRKNEVDSNSEKVAKNNPCKTNGGKKQGVQDGTQENQKGQGLVNFLSGIRYQLTLLIAVLCHAAKLKRQDEMFDFEITSEDPSGGIFDDIGIRFKDGDRWRELFIQVKHKADKTKSITWNDLTSSDKRAPFAII